MLICPVCNKIKDNSSELARHIIMKLSLQEEDSKHKDWLEKQELNLKIPIKSLTELFERGELK
ncbi:hypothetical protein COV16_01630 [Candidatus Woesearchaeota archaeon CG10_big_fil_rev_8_21_14_0_10_34_8]|nr:MAG: hypothetical protein COV16_01630 [Candidatus Woesearchaeota archaeon CG10_big_fil_rev_8_21_14_0_10_34_8]